MCVWIAIDKNHTKVVKATSAPETETTPPFTFLYTSHVLSLSTYQSDPATIHIYPSTSPPRTSSYRSSHPLPPQKTLLVHLFPLFLYNSASIYVPISAYPSFAMEKLSGSGIGVRM